MTGESGRACAEYEHERKRSSHLCGYRQRLLHDIPANDMKATVGAFRHRPIIAKPDAIAGVVDNQTKDALR